jgi:hypothetical protein
MGDNVTPFPDQNGPDPEFVMTDGKGQKMFFFAAIYQYEGSNWSVEFWAYSMSDALDRLAAMRETAGLGDPQCFQILKKISD